MTPHRNEPRSALLARLRVLYEGLEELEAATCERKLTRHDIDDLRIDAEAAAVIATPVAVDGPCRLN